MFHVLVDLRQDRLVADRERKAVQRGRGIHGFPGAKLVQHQSHRTIGVVSRPSACRHLGDDLEGHFGSLSLFGRAAGHPDYHHDSDRGHDELQNMLHGNPSMVVSHAWGRAVVVG